MVIEVIGKCVIDNIGVFRIADVFLVIFVSCLSSNICVIVVLFSNVMHVHVMVTRL